MNQLTQLERRLSRLEQQMTAQRRSLRRSRTACAVLGFALIGTIGLAAASQRPVEQVIQANRFEVLDRNNNLVAALDADALGGKLDLWTIEGRNVLRAATNDAGGDITIWNTRGSAVYGAYATEAGSETAHWNADGRPSSVITANADGGHVRLLTDLDQPTMHLNSTDRGGELITFHPDGQQIASLGAGAHGGRFALHNRAGKMIIHADANDQQHGRLRISSSSGDDPSCRPRPSCRTTTPRCCSPTRA
jgi:hypothetical protein